MWQVVAAPPARSSPGDDHLAGGSGAPTATAQTITEFTLPAAASGPGGIAAGLDVPLWFTQIDRNRIGRITTAAPAPLPSLSEWAMVLFGLMLAGGAVLYIQRRQLTTWIVKTETMLRGLAGDSGAVCMSANHPERTCTTSAYGASVKCPQSGVR